MRSVFICTSLTSFSVLPALRVRRAHHRRTRPALQVVARNRILLTPSEVEDGYTVRLPAHDSRTNHILQILKLEPGDEVKVGIINGAIGQAKVAQTSPEVILECQQWVQPLATAQLYVVLAMPRPKVMRRLWSTLACLGITRVYITGAEKVEKAYFGARILEPRAFVKELIIGAEQAGDTRLPAVFFSRSLKSTIASLPPTYATDAVTPHKANASLVQTLNGGQAQTLNAGQVQTLLEEGATEWDVGRSKLSVSALQQQGDSISCRGKTATPAGHLAGPPKGSLGPLPDRNGSKSDTMTATAVQDDGKDQTGSTACVAAKTSVAQAVAMATAHGSGGSYGGPHVIKLLAHTEGGVSVQQAVSNHFVQCPQSESTAASLPDDRSDHVGNQKSGQLQVAGSQSSARAAVVDAQLQDGSAERKPVAVLAVGPEGGWTPSEIALMTEEHAFQIVTTAGGRTLDTTTAIISLVSLVGEAIIRYSDQQTS